MMDRVPTFGPTLPTGDGDGEGDRLGLGNGDGDTDGGALLGGGAALGADFAHAASSITPAIPANANRTFLDMTFMAFLLARSG
jgi:hypothetical protein